MISGWVYFDVLLKDYVVGWIFPKQMLKTELQGQERELGRDRSGSVT